MFCPQCGNKLIKKNIDGVSRPYCQIPSCGYIHWNNPVPVITALVRHSNQYILARNVNWPVGIFSLIAGFLEQGEIPESAVAREVEEELGLVPQDVRFIGHYHFREKNQLIIAFEVNAHGEIRKNYELAEIKKLSHEELLQYDFRPLYITDAIIRDWETLVSSGSTGMNQ